MPEWKFPNAVAFAVKAAALQSGQKADRMEPPDPQYPIPLHFVVEVGGMCGRSPLNIHTVFRDGRFCDSCGALVQGG